MVEIRNAIEQWLRGNKNIVLACSALKQTYRHLLVRDTKNITIVYLKGSFDLFAQRLKKRKNHFMKFEMLKSQFNDLEEPEKAIVIDAGKSAQEIVNSIRINL